MTDPKQFDEIIEENKRLRAKVAELEKAKTESRHGISSFGKDQPQVAQVLKLLEQRDHTLEELATELQQKKQELEETIVRLEERNVQLNMWISALGMYQQMLDNESYAVLGFNRDAKLILYNKAAVTEFGEQVRGWRLQEVEDLDFSQLDPHAPAFVREMLSTGKAPPRSITRGGRTITTTGFMMGTAEDPSGVLIKIAVGK